MLVILMPRRIIIFLTVLILAVPSRTATLKPEIHPGRSSVQAENIYTDSNYSVLIKGQSLAVTDNKTEKKTGLTLQPSGGSRDLQNVRYSASRNGDMLRLSAGGMVYMLQLGPSARITAVYPEPGCSGDKIIVDKQSNMLYLFKGGDFSRSYKVATGKKPEYTPEGSFFIVNKASMPPGSETDRFGPRWMGIGVPSHCDLRAEKPDERAPRGIKYGIHGTDEPWSIGKHASAGCIRLSNSDIIDLFDRVEVGTPVEIVR